MFPDSELCVFDALYEIGRPAFDPHREVYLEVAAQPREELPWSDRLRW
jgi:hypothetical protein